MRSIVGGGKRKSGSTWGFGGDVQVKETDATLRMDADLLPLPFPDVLNSCELSESHQLALP